jgi:branched-subunit amino acid transport protein AzlD
MDLSLLSFIVGTVIAVIGLSIPIAALEESKRNSLVRFWKRWIRGAFLAILLINSAFGIWLFWNTTGLPSRSQILVLLLHIFNLFGVPFILLMTAMDRVLDVRNAKRTELEQKVRNLELQIQALTSFKALPHGATVPSKPI